jgi:hypothetical protein
VKLPSLSLLLPALLAACSEEVRPTPVVRTELQPPRRVVAPPTGTVRSLPPHAIRADGVGPYRLGEKVSALMAQLPSGPRIARLEIPGVVRTSVIRAEEDTVLIGGETAGTARFVAVVGADVARTDSDVHVGTSEDAVRAVAGEPRVALDAARDPRLHTIGALPNARIVVERGRVAAIIVTAEAPAGRVAAAALAPGECRRPQPPAGDLGACLTPAGEIIAVAGGDPAGAEVDRGSPRDRDVDAIAIRPADGGRAALVARAPGLVFAGVLRNPADGRDEVAVVTRTEEAQQRTWALSVLRVEGARLMRAVDSAPVYTLSAAQTRWIGAELRDVELYLELASRADAIEVTGLIVTGGIARAGSAARDVALLAPRLVARRSSRAPAQAPGAADATAGAPSEPSAAAGSAPIEPGAEPAGSGSAGSAARRGSARRAAEPSGAERGALGSRVGSAR